MATQGGDIRFTFTGDSSGLNSELKKIDKNLGEVSKATASASNGMQKGLVKGAKAADNAADRLGVSLSKAKKEMDQAAASAGKMGTKMDAASDGFGQASSSLSSVGSVLGEVNPHMGQLAGTAAMASGAMEGVIKVAKTHPVAFAAVAAATVIAGLAFSGLQEQMEAQEEAYRKLDRRQDIHMKRLGLHGTLLEEIEGAYNDAAFGASTLDAEAGKLHMELSQRDKLLHKSISLQVSYGEISLAVGKKNILKLKEETAAAHDLIDETHLLKEAKLEEAKALAEFHAHQAKFAASKKKAADQQAAADKAEAERRARWLESKKSEAAFLKKMGNARRSALDFALSEEEAIARKASLKIEALSAEFDALESGVQKEETVRQALADATVAVHAEMNSELADLDDKRAADSLKLGQELLEGDRKFAEEQIANREEYLAKLKTMDDSFRESEAEAEAEAQADKVKGRDDAMAAGLAITSGVLEITAMLEEEMANASIEERKRLFAIQKGASIADAAINGAVAVTRALAELGPIAGAIAAGVITATTAAQISMIAGQEPAFDVGGMVRGGVMSSSSDQMAVSVLPGEAVLNRSATEGLGESGVNALNRGSGLGGVTVVPAYRHFDRFIADEYRKGGSFRRIVTKERDYPVGQRRY
jgi:hypothetical protein